MTSAAPKSPLIDLLKHTLIPWAERYGINSVHIACGDWNPLMDLPEGMTATRKPLRGKRMAKRGGRAYGTTSIVNASWPEDGLQSARTPKLCFVIAGAIALQVNNYVLHCQPGHGILLPAGTPFSSGSHLFLDPAKQHQGICEILQMMPYHDGLICWLSHRRIDEVGKAHVQESTCCVPRSRVPIYLNQLVDETSRNQTHRLIICDSLLKIALAFLLRELDALPVLETGEIHDSQIPLPTENRAYSIKHAQEYIENNLREQLSIDKVARNVCMSRTVFTAQFRAKMGKTFSEYVQERRLEEARKLLQGSDLAIRHVSSAVGLRSNRMRVLFHEHEGVSPQEFRNRSRPE